MKVLIFDAILFVIVGIPLALLWGKLAHKRKEQTKEELRQEFEAEQAAHAATQQPQPRQPKPGSVEDYERWKKDRKKRQEEGL